MVFLKKEKLTNKTLKTIWGENTPSPRREACLRIQGHQLNIMDVTQVAQATNDAFLSFSLQTPGKCVK